MKKAILTLSVALFYLLVFAAQPVYAVHRICLMHPTAGNLENFMKLQKAGVVTIPDLEVIGFYSDKESYDYAESERFIREKGLTGWSLRKVSADLTNGNVYGENGATADFRWIVENVNAILFFGGPDIQPALYGEKQHLLTVVTDPGRHLFETSFFFHLMGGSRNPSFAPLLKGHPDLVVRAFCLGMQTMNVAAGGTLIQDIPLQKYYRSSAEEMLALDSLNQHRNYNTQLNPTVDLAWARFHPVKFTKKGFLSGLYGGSNATRPMILSSHHQAVGKLGSDLDVIAWSFDGQIVEALQHRKFQQVVGVQFHPEAFVLYDEKGKLEVTPARSIVPATYLKEHESMEFHRLFWNDFSSRVTKAVGK